MTGIASKGVLDKKRKDNLGDLILFGDNSSLSNGLPQDIKYTLG
jgi:hypothetical protein